MVRTNGANKNGQIVPENWIDDIKNYKDNSCYLNQDDLKDFLMEIIDQNGIKQVLMKTNSVQ